MDLNNETAPWGRGRGSNAFQLGLCTFGILALELALIRWIGGQIRLIAYFSNLVLLASFLGMGLGIAIGRKRPGLVHACLPALGILSIILAFADKLNLVHLKFPDPSIALWGSEASGTLALFFGASILMLAFFWMIVSIFCLAAVPVGWLFNRLSPLTAYSADLFGSLLGVIAMTIVAALGTSPVIWMGLGIISTLWFSRRLLSFVSGIAIIILAYVSIQGAHFSPYYRIDVEPIQYGKSVASKFKDRQEWNLNVNRDYHQRMLDLSDERVGASAPNSDRRLLRVSYDIPFVINEKKGRALVVGAGSGNNVMAALRHGYDQVVCVDIDKTIMKLGQQLHPEKPYLDPRSVLVVNDARAYFEQNPNERFDVICFGLLDSHTMFSAMSSLRLDNFVYTKEGLQAAWRHLNDDGVLSVSFSVFAGDWISNRMLGIIREGTGMTPILIPQGTDDAITYVVGPRLDEQRVNNLFPGAILGAVADRSIRTPTDDWPFLYLRPNTIPYTYISVMALILLTAVLAVRKVYGREVLTYSSFNAPLFLMGAAFMLLESRMVTALSLLFGSTWVVNSAVFAGILVMVLVANLIVARREPKRIEIWYLPLAVSLLITWLVGAGTLNKLPLLERGLVGGILYALPVAFAGVIFSYLLKHSKDPSIALGSNLLGAVVGGIIEYSSMYFGLRAMVLIVLALYLSSLLLVLRRNPEPVYAEAPKVEPIGT